MFCSQCGVIIGRKFPQGMYKCPKCENILRVAAFRVIDEKDSHEFIGLEGNRRRLCCLFVDEAKIKLLLKQQTTRPDDWLPFMLALEEERLRALVKKLGWIISAIFRDPGPTSSEQDRPFVQIEKDIKDSITNTIVVTDFSRVTRKALHTLYEAAAPHGVEIIAIAPHKYDENLVMPHVDYDVLPGYLTKSPLLERIWNDRCDACLRACIKKYGWHWISYGADLLVKEIGEEAIREWRENDTACSHRHWKEVLSYWAMAYVRKHKLYMDLAVPKLRACTSCRRNYLDSAVPIHLVELSNFRKNHCRTCLSKAFFYTPKRYARFLTSGPPSRLSDMDDFIAMFRSMDRERFDEIVKKVFAWRETERRNAASSIWLKALIDAGVLKGFGALSSSETFYRALDGHACMSIGAAMVDNFLYLHHIPHKVEVRYPTDMSLNKSGSLRADFAVDDTMIEYGGLWGEEEMKKDMATREELCKKNRFQFIKVFTEDLICPTILERKFEAFICKAEGSAEEPLSQQVSEQNRERE